MMELGSPLEMIQLLQTPWEERFKVRKQNKREFYQPLLDRKLGKCGDPMVAAGANEIVMLTLCLLL